MKRSVIFGVVSLAIVGLLGFVGGRASNKEVSKANNKTTSSYSSNGNTQNNVDKEIANSNSYSNSYSNKYNNSYNNSISNSNNYQGSNDDISFELSEEDLANLKNGLGLTVNGQNVDITGFDEKFREEVKAAGFE